LATAGQKDPGALLTIGELSQELGVAQHILRYWETKFPQLRPMQRAGNRRYYRPADVELAHLILRLLTEEGYTVRGVQKLLRDKAGQAEAPFKAAPAPVFAPQPAPHIETEQRGGIDIDRLRYLRDRLADALDR
jgi:DNA-binding transcriptional MerR regulator